MKISFIDSRIIFSLPNESFGREVKNVSLNLIIILNSITNKPIISIFNTTTINNKIVSYILVSTEKYTTFKPENQFTPSIHLNENVFNTRIYSHSTDNIRKHSFRQQLLLIKGL